MAAHRVVDELASRASWFKDLPSTAGNSVACGCCAAASSSTADRVATVEAGKPKDETTVEEELVVAEWAAPHPATTATHTATALRRTETATIVQSVPGSTFHISAQNCDIRHEHICVAF